MAVQSVSSAQEQVPPLRKVAQIASSLQKLEDGYEAAQKLVAENKNDIDAHLALLEADVKVMNAIGQCCQLLNTNGGPDWSGSNDQFPRGEVVPLVFARIAQDNKANRHVPSDKMEFAQVYSDGPAPNSYPAWYKAIRTFVGYEDESSQFPDTFAYLRSSPSVGAKGRKLTEKYVASKGELETALRQEVRSNDYNQAEKTKLDILQEGKALLAATKDIDVRNVQDVLNVISVRFQPKKDYVDRTLDNFHSAEALVVRLLEEGDTTQLETALGRFFDIRENLFALHGLLPTRDAARQASSGTRTSRDELCASRMAIDKAACQLFPQSGVSLTETLIQNKALRSSDVMLQLLTSRYVIDGDFFSQHFVVDREENAVLMDLLSQKLLFSDDDERASLAPALRRAEVSDIVELCAEFRGYIESRNVDTLVERLDEEIQAVYEKPLGSLTHTRALLSVIAAIAAEPKVVQPIKGRMRNQKLLSEMVTSVTKNIGKKNSRAAAVLEANRATINKGFSNTLKDYWGQQELKKDVTRIVEKNLLLANEPERYRGMPRHLAFINGILLSGIPGVGKTFLVECLANEYGLEMTEVSMEELRKQMSAESSSQVKKGNETPKARQDIEATIDSFLESKVKIARDKMKASGATSGILMIDEMEAEFLRRNPETSPRNELEQTNIMLRVFERVMRNNPDIIFFGATNHPEHVDPAAVRPGRFGIDLVVEPPTEADIKEILEGTFGTIGLIADALAMGEKYDDLVDECQGLLPLPIQNAIVHSFAVSDLDRKEPDIDEAIKIFIEAVQWMKQHIKQPQIDQKHS